jgi:hypothetical protein
MVLKKKKKKKNLYAKRSKKKKKTLCLNKQTEPKRIKPDHKELQSQNPMALGRFRLPRLVLEALVV